MTKLMEKKEVAEYLGVCPRTVDRLVSARKIPFIRLPLGRSIRFHHDQIERWVRCNTTIESLR